LWDAIDEYRHSERIKTEIEAIRRLLEMGLEAAGKSRPPPGRKRQR
jgi:hypothetical protein